MNFPGTLSCHPSQGWECPLWLILKKGSSVRSLIPFGDAASHGSQRALPSVLRGREPGLVELVGDLFWLEPQLCPHF